ncbi:MAG: hypothetical protein OHK0013_16290 [Sandaracinaceae bacterium]
MPGAEDTGLDVRFFDFEGRLREEVAPDTATAASVEITAIDVGSGTVEGTVRFTFGDGSATGTFRATQCVSLDGPTP